MTAARRALPFETWVLLENLDNRPMAEVRINVRGPFVDDRLLGLSYAVACASAPSKPA